METAQDNPSTAPQYRKFPIAQIKTSRSQARERTLTNQSLMELTQSMKENGLDNSHSDPLSCRMVRPELVSGERRLRAAKQLEWTEIDAKVYPALSDQDAVMKGVIENIQRQNLT